MRNTTSCSPIRLLQSGTCLTPPSCLRVHTLRKTGAWGHGVIECQADAKAWGRGSGSRRQGPPLPCVWSSRSLPLPLLQVAGADWLRAPCLSAVPGFRFGGWLFACSLVGGSRLGATALAGAHASWAQGAGAELAPASENPFCLQFLLTLRLTSRVRKPFPTPEHQDSKSWCRRFNSGPAHHHAAGLRQPWPLYDRRRRPLPRARQPALTSWTADHVCGHPRAAATPRHPGARRRMQLPSRHGLGTRGKAPLFKTSP